MLTIAFVVIVGYLLFALFFSSIGLLFIDITFFIKEKIEDIKHYNDRGR